MLMECLSFAFYVAKLQDTARARILHGSDDNNGDWEGGVAEPEGGANLEDVARPVPEQEEAVLVVSPSELVVSTGVSKVLRHYLSLDVHRKASKAQDSRRKALQ